MAERQSAQMSKIANDHLTRSGTGCFIAVPIWQQWASNGSGDVATYCTTCDDNKVAYFSAWLIRPLSRIGSVRLYENSLNHCWSEFSPLAAWSTTHIFLNTNHKMFFSWCIMVLKHFAFRRPLQNLCPPGSRHLALFSLHFNVHFSFISLRHIWNSLAAQIISNCTLSIFSWTWTHKCII